MKYVKWILFSWFVFIVAGCALSNPQSYVRPENIRVKLNRDIVSLYAFEIAGKIRNRELTSEEVVDAFFNQIYAYNPELNAIVILNEKEARERAIAADKAMARGEIWGPLHGVPVTVKDHFDVKGLRTTNGYPPMKDNVSNHNSIIVQRLKNAGAIIIGKTNMPPFGMDYQTDNPIFGRTNNPLDLQTTPGGSTGGGAAAVAAGLTPLEIGSDIGGSIRVPAHYCGIFGFKPTENIVPDSIDYTSDKEAFISRRHMLSVGPLARSMQDLKLVFPIIAGSDYQDVNVPSVSLNFPQPKPVNTLRVAWTDYYPGVPVSNETRNIIQSFVDNLRNKGVIVERVPNKELDALVADAHQTWLELNYMESRGLTHPSVYRLFLYLFNLDKGVVFPFSYENYLKILTKRDRIVSKMDRFLSKWDAFLYPVSSTPAFNHMTPTRIWWDVHRVYNQSFFIDDKPFEYDEAIGSRTWTFNLTGNPVVVFPIGQTKKGLPIGIQVIGQRWQDPRLLVTAEQLYNFAGSYNPPKPYFSNE
ncbi:MAG: amidase [Desulfobacteraceae bacterium]|nr:amidase [Desulfobacteraceae bacterium]